MAFIKKEWADRIVEFANRRRLTFEDGSSQLVTVSREEGDISEEGDAFSAENMNELEERIESEFTALNRKLPKVLWTNPNPTASFEGQTITLNSTDYDYLVVCSTTGGSTSNSMYTSSMVEKGEVLNSFYVTSSGANNGNLLSRRFRNGTVSEDGATITFDDGHRHTNGSIQETDNKYVIPIRVIGYYYQ